MKIADIQEAGKQVLDLLGKYHNPPHKELLLEAILFVYLSGRYSNVSRQKHVRVHGSTKPHRIDLRIGGTNPVVIELAPRPPFGGGQLAGSQNIKELRKLCRVTQSEAKLRALLLLDLAHDPISIKNLRKTYDPLHAGRGKFDRHSVRVIYVHRRATFTFSWSPYKAA